MLFEGIFAPDSELYFQQLIAELAGPLDTGAFVRAWQAVVDRHPALRTAFAWEGLKWPLQVVRRGARLPWTEEDWRQVPPREVPERLAAWLAADRARSFDLARPPLMRAALLRTGEDRLWFVWSFHHLLIDGWCLSLIFREVFALYRAAVAGRDALLPAVRPYRDFIAWVARQDAAATDDFFRRQLAGFTAATRLPLDRPALPAGDDGPPPDQVLRLPPALVARLTALAQSRELTLNTLAQGAWALLLARYGGTPDVVFGTVVSGRPAELPGVESMIGLFINTLPVRLAVDPAAPLDVWLAGVQKHLLELRQHETAALAQIQRASEVPPGEPLFQSIVAFENFPVDESLGEGAGEIAFSGVTVTGRTDYPLSFAVMPGRRDSNELSLSLSHDRRTDATTARRLLGHLERLLDAFAAFPGSPLGELPVLSTAERHQLVLEWNDTATETAEDLCLHDLDVRPGAAPPRGGGPRRRGPGDHLRRARPAHQPARQSPRRAGRRAGITGGDHGGALARDGGGGARDPEGRRRLRADRSRDAGRPPGFSPRRCPAGAPAHRGRAGGPSARGRGRRRGPRRRAGAHRCGERRAPRGRGRSRQSRLRHLHLGIDRDAQGGRRPPSLGGGLRPRRGAGVWDAGWRSRAAVRLAELRRQRRGDLRAARRRGDRRPAERAGRGAGAVPRQLRGAGDHRAQSAHGLLAPDRGGGRERGSAAPAGPAPDRHGRRAGPARALDRLGPRPGPPGAAGQRLRPDRGDDRGDAPRASGNAGPARRTAGGADRPAAPRRARPGRRPRSAAGSRRRDRRAGAGRSGGGARLSRPSRPDRGAVRARPALRRARRAPLSHRGSRPAPPGRHPRVRRPPRRPGQGARLPDRAGGDRSRSRHPSRPARGGGGGLPRRFAARLRGAHRRGGAAGDRGAAGLPRRAAPRAHGAHGLCRPARAPPDVQRQGGPAGAGAAGACDRARGREGRSRHAARRDARPGRRRGARRRCRAGGHAGQLLRSRRPLAARHATGFATEPGARHPGDAADGLRCLGPRRAGRPYRRGRARARRFRPPRRGAARDGGDVPRRDPGPARRRCLEEDA